MPSAPASKAPSRLRLFLLGLLFEITLFVLALCLPEGSWLASRVRNGLFIMHAPILSFFGFSPLAPLLALFPMAVFWAFLFYWLLHFRNWLSKRVLVSTGRKVVAGGVVGLAMVFILAMAVVSAMPQTPRPFDNSPEVKSVVEANTAFAIDLYKKLKVQPGNLFFSPYSISSALAMTSAGAREQTETEMAKTLHFDAARANVDTSFRQLTERINQVQRWNGLTLSSANSLWSQRHYPFDATFLNLIHSDYDADARPVDFVRDPEAARHDINSWVEKKTDGEIQNLVGSGQLSTLSRLVLCNAIYFKGKWQTQFKPDDTKPAPFYVSTNQTVTVPMMWQHSEFKVTYSDDLSVQLLEMPYVGNDLSMIVILPVTETGDYTFANIEEEFTAENLRAWLARLDQESPHEANVSFPRFTTVQTVGLSEQLKSLGMRSAFSDTADFSGMDGATNNLYISEVIHQAFVTVDESGTEAAAATWVHVTTRSASDRFIANHPFIFLIRDNGSGSILFLGRIVDPTK
jgi:serine protease inhibitor